MNDNELPKRRSTAGDQLMTLDEVAEYIQVPVKTLYDWRHRGCGPSGMRVGRHVRYRRAEHEEDRWVAASALWLGLPLVAHDGIFRDVPGLELLILLS